MLKSSSISLVCLAFAFCLGLVSSCSKDDEPLPAYRQDLAELFTDNDGFLSKFVADNGDTLLISRNSQVNRLVPDTVYRIKAAYTKQDNQIQVLSMQRIFSMAPLSEAPSNISHDAIQVDAVWRAGRYVNLMVSFKTSGTGKHALAFVDEGISIQSDGSKLLRIALLHSRNNDGEDYTRQDCMSCLVSGYASVLQSNRDSIALTYPSQHGTLEKHVAF